MDDTIKNSTANTEAIYKAQLHTILFGEMPSNGNDERPHSNGSNDVVKLNNQINSMHNDVKSVNQNTNRNNDSVAVINIDNNGKCLVNNSIFDYNKINCLTQSL